ncbi:hypothetical protein [Actinomycetospora sp. CA-053990]
METSPPAATHAGQPPSSTATRSGRMPAQRSTHQARDDAIPSPPS